MRQWNTASDADVCRFYERLMSLYPDDAQLRKNLVLACWACHLHCDRTKAEELAEAQKWLRRGLQVLRDNADHELLITAEQKKIWIADFEKRRRDIAE